MTVLNEVILASSSPRRVELLRSLGFQVEVRPTYVAEDDVPGLTPRELAAHHSSAKAAAALALLDGTRPGKPIPSAMTPSPTFALVCADTVVDLDGRALGKPRDLAASRATIASLSGREHLVHTAVDVAIPSRGVRTQLVETTAVRFFALEPTMIDAYVASRDGLDKAGAYGIQGAGASLVERIDGDFYTVMGFPVGRFVQFLASHDLVPPALAPALAGAAT